MAVNMSNTVLLEIDSWRGFHTPRLCRGYKGIALGLSEEMFRAVNQ